MLENVIATSAGHWYWPDGRPCYTWKYPDKWAVIHKNGKRATKVYGYAPINGSDYWAFKCDSKTFSYTKEAYNVEHRPGDEVNTTLHHAKKYGLVPGQGRVNDVENKPGLNFWQIEQHLDAAATEPTSRKDVSADEWKQIVKKEAERQAEEARQKGVEIHGAIERYAQTANADDVVSGQYAQEIANVYDMLNFKYGIRLIDCDAEKSAAHPWGYGCKTDLLNKERRFIADVKCKEFFLDGDRAWKSYDAYERYKLKDSNVHQDQPIKLHWPEHCRQIAANAHAHGLVTNNFWSFSGDDEDEHFYTGINIYVSTSNPGQVYIHEWTEDELKHELRKFYFLLQYWKLDNKYDSSEAFRKEKHEQKG